VLLLNAVYFKGQWRTNLIRRRRSNGLYACRGAVKRVPRMAQSGRFDYSETPEMQAIRLPFGEEDLVMEILLPSNHRARRVGSAAHSRALDELASTICAAPGKIELPRFELKSIID